MFPIPGIETALKAYKIFGNAMYQGYAQTELLPVAMLGAATVGRQGRARPAAAACRVADLGGEQSTAECSVDGRVKIDDIGRRDENGYLCMLDRADDRVIGRLQLLSGRTGERDRCSPRGRRGRGVRHARSRTRWCVKPEASVTEKELVELCSVHPGNDKRPGKVVLPRPVAQDARRQDQAQGVARAVLGGSRAAGCRELTDARCRVGEDESRG